MEKSEEWHNKAQTQIIEEKYKERKRKISATYTLKAIGEHAEKLLELKLIDISDFEIIEQIQAQAIAKYIKK